MGFCLGRVVVFLFLFCLFLFFYLKKIEIDYSTAAVLE